MASHVKRRFKSALVAVDVSGWRRGRNRGRNASTSNPLNFSRSSGGMRPIPTNMGYVEA